MAFQKGALHWLQLAPQPSLESPAVFWGRFGCRFALVLGWLLKLIDLGRRSLAMSGPDGCLADCQANLTEKTSRLKVSMAEKYFGFVFDGEKVNRRNQHVEGTRRFLVHVFW